jgi:CheY-like chemotaxis protein
VDVPDAAALRAQVLAPLQAGTLEVATPHELRVGALVTLVAQCPGEAPLEVGVEVARRLSGVDGMALRLRAGPTGTAAVPVFHVLLVEDNPHIVQMYSRALRRVFPEEQATMEVECVENGHEALQRLARAPALDLVVTDLYMPVIDGFVLAEKMKQDPRTADIPVVLISAAGKEAESKAQELGIRTFLHKPVQLNMIVDSVRLLLRTPG